MVLERKIKDGTDWTELKATEFKGDKRAKS